MNEDLNIDVKRLKPITRFIYTIGVLPTSYLMSMTYEEQLIWLCNYLEKTVIPTINNNGEAVKEVQEFVIELRDYVNNYFDNLDLQSEVDNKLEEMYENGQLQSLIEQFIDLQVTFTYDSIADMKQATNLVNGATVRTNGFYQYDDKGGALYRVRTITISDTVDEIHLFAITGSENLVAELIPSNEINILQLGAYDDDNTKASENTTIIQYALDNFDKVIVGVGKFYTGKLTIPDHTILAGIDNVNSELILSGDDTVLLETVEWNSDNKLEIVIENLRLYGANAEGTSGLHVLTSYVKIINCYIGYFGDNGILIEKSNNVEIEKCFINGNGVGINAQYNSQGQINAIWIHNNNIGQNDVGIRFFGNNVIIRENTFEANTTSSIDVGDSSWNNDYNQYCYGSIIQNNYTELTGGSSNNVVPVINIYSGYVVDRTYNRVIRRLEIKDNYFGEANADNTNAIVNVVTDTTSAPDSRATTIIVKDNYSESKVPVQTNIYNALGYQSEVHSNSTYSDSNNLPYYVKQNYFKGNDPSKDHTDNYINLRRRISGSFANTTNQLTILIYPKDVSNVSDITLATMNSVLKAIITGYHYGGSQSQFFCEAEGQLTVTSWDGKYTYKETSTNGVKVSPITLVQNHPNFDQNVNFGYQITLLPLANSSIYNIFLDLLINENILRFINIEIISTTANTGASNPVSATYRGQVFYNTTNSKWYVANYDLASWREINVN